MARTTRWMGMAGIVLAALVCASCFSPWTGEEAGDTGSVTIRIGASRNRLVMGWPVAEENIPLIAHTVKLWKVEWNPDESIHEPSEPPVDAMTQEISAQTAEPTASFPNLTPGDYAIEVLGTWHGKNISYYLSPIGTPAWEPITVVAGQTARPTVTMERHPEWTVSYITIESAEDLALIGIGSNYPPDGNYLLMDDITLNIDNDPLFSWTPIGTFTGTFDGQGNTIRGLRIDTSDPVDNQGLFGQIGVNGTVKNLKLENVAINTPNGNAIGAIAGINHGVISDCEVSGTVRGSGNVGGVVGYMVGSNASSAMVTRCDSAANVTGGSEVDAVSGAGGVVGNNNYGTVEFCFAEGNVTGGLFIGGVVGSNGHSSSMIRNSYYAGGTVGGKVSVGGVAGSNVGVVENCYASGDVAIILGAILVSGANDYIGGVVGSNSAGTITNCVALVTNFYVPANPTNIGRVSGSSGVTLTNNYGNIDMTLDIDGAASENWTPALDGQDGADVDLTDLTEAWWTGTLLWSDTVWNFTDASHPTLNLDPPPAP